MSELKTLICPFCGARQPASTECGGCGTPLDGETQRTTLARMGPWYLRSEAMPFMPGCSWEQLASFVTRGIVTRDSVLRGPTTRQLWTSARRVPGIAHLLGVCHACQTRVDSTAAACPSCRASFGAPLDRNDLGLPTGVEETKAHEEPVESERVSAFATNDELREGLHDEVRRRRSLGGTHGLQHPQGSGALGGGAAGIAGGTTDRVSSARLPGGVLGIDPRRSRTRIPGWMIIAGGSVATASLVIVIAVAATARGGPSGTSQPSGATGVTGATIHGDAKEPSRPAPPESRAAEAPRTTPARTPTPAPAVESPPASAAAPSASAPAPPAATAPPTPAAPAPPPDPFASIDALLRRARDASLTRPERRRAVEEAIALLDAMTKSAAGGTTPDAIAERRARVDEEGRRIQAEIFLRGDGAPS